MSHQLPELPEPAQQQQYVCTKCGKTGPGSGEWHNRLDGSPCGYMALHHGPWFTADQMRAYAELAIASVKREPLSEFDKSNIAAAFAHIDRVGYARGWAGYQPMLDYLRDLVLSPPVTATTASME